MTEDEMRDLFREMREEPVPADSLARVRQGVEQRRRRAAPWKILAALAAAACIVAGFLILRPGKPVQPASLPEIAQVTAAAPAEIPVPPAPKAKRARRRTPRAQAVPVLIRIETPDPDVVILLVN
jgi:hypothetical protein